MSDNDEVIRLTRERDLLFDMWIATKNKWINALLERFDSTPVLHDRKHKVGKFHYERKGACPRCHKEIMFLWNREFCGFCGKAVKWP